MFKSIILHLTSMNNFRFSIHKVKAPSDTLWIFPSGKMVIGPNQFKNTGHWVTYKPHKEGEKKK